MFDILYLASNSPLSADHRNMLSTNSILRQGRYRIIEHFSSVASHNVYDAYDNLLGNKVVVHETVPAQSKVVTSTDRNASNATFAQRIQTLKDIRHDGIVRVRDGFSELDRQYLVTEPVEARPARQEFLTQPVDTISRLLLALEFINKLDTSGSVTDITPTLIRRTSDGNNRILYFGSTERSNQAVVDDRENLPFRPLESLWNGLDLASQKAISNGYDEASLETLESRPDARSSIYSLGATVYKILTGTSPADSLERSIEILDGKTDPLQTPNAIDPTIGQELSAFVMTCLQLKREDRFQTISEARIALVTVPAGSHQIEAAPAPNFEEHILDLDEFDLLEIPNADIIEQPKQSQVAPLPVPTVQETASDEDFLMSELAVDEVPTIKPAPLDEPQEIFSASDYSQSEQKPRSFKVAAMAVAGLVVAGGIGWGVFSFTSTDNRVADADMNKSSAVLKEPATASSQTPVTEPAVSASPEPVYSSYVPEVTTPANLPQEQPKPRPVIADAKVTKKPDAQPTPKPAVKPKKSVTVDDLISDN